MPDVPEPLSRGKLHRQCTIKEVPDAAALSKFLNDHGLDTSDWGKGNTKAVQKFWTEIRDDESGLEIWHKEDGTPQVVRVTHVLRAKVCSPDSFKRGVFLFNTWQQFGDGRKRVRNGLLSEKLTMSEMPLEKHLHEVCQRAVTEEEMQRLADPLLKIGPGSPAPVYDKNYVCPLDVVDECFADHVIEIEASKSYPRLLTMYHLYTVDIVCTGLPVADFNTLEFDHQDECGNRKLKYVHAWVWMEWSQIQRYLFEGSTMKERKAAGSFKDSKGLAAYLGNFNLDLEVWGKGSFKSVDSLFDELERQESHLELWGRQDGVPLLMRVLHVLQLKVFSSDPRLRGKFIYHTWSQSCDGRHKVVNRLMTKKLNIACLPLDRAKFNAETEAVVRQQLAYIMDPHFRLTPEALPNTDALEPCDLKLKSVNFLDHRVDVDNSPTFKGLCTLYHLYTCEVECEGLPHANFASLEVRNRSGRRDLSASYATAGAQDLTSPRRVLKDGSYIANALGWCWVVLPQCLDMAHSRNTELEEQLMSQRKAVDAQEMLLKSKSENTERLMQTVKQHICDPSVPKNIQERVNALLADVREREAREQETSQHIKKAINTEQPNRRLPPSMVSEMAEDSWMSEDIFAQGAAQAQMKELDSSTQDFLDKSAFKAQVKELDSCMVPTRNPKPCGFPWCLPAC